MIKSHPRRRLLHLLLLLSCLLPLCSGCRPLPEKPGTPSPSPDVVKDELDTELVRKLVTAWKADKVPTELIATAYGTFSGLARVSDSPSLQETIDFPTMLGKVQTTLQYDLKAYPQVYKLLTEASDVATGGAPKAAKRLKLTTELRKAYRKYCQSVAESCRLSL